MLGKSLEKNETFMEKRVTCHKAHAAEVTIISRTMLFLFQIRILYKCKKIIIQKIIVVSRKWKKKMQKLCFLKYHMPYTKISEN